jgi:predicted heme/steroid binding protein
MEPNKKKKISLIQIDRASAWVLLFSIIAYMLSGYGMTKGIFDSQFSRFMHRNVLPTITMIAFVGHTSLAVRTAMMRKRMWNKTTKILLILAYTLGFLSFIYLEVFIMRDRKITDATDNLSNYERSVSVENDSADSTEDKETGRDQGVFTLEELAQYDGKNGNPAYAAVDGIVYDLTQVFENGNHLGHSAGEELTEEFYSTHTIEKITKYPVVGILE